MISHLSFLRSFLGKKVPCDMAANQMCCPDIAADIVLFIPDIATWYLPALLAGRVSHS